MNFAEKVKTMRKQFEMSQEQLAEKINVSRQAITKWETGGGIPDVENLLAIAALFNISVDELMSAKKNIRNASGFLYESITEYDIDYKKHYDINAGGAFEVVIESTESEKIRVRLASNVINTLESSFKVKIDDRKSRIDVNVNRVGNVSEAQAKEALYIFIGIPSKFLVDLELSAIINTLRVNHMEINVLEFDGKVSNVHVNSIKGLLELNCSTDMNIVCAGLNGCIDINQISATSTIHVPKGTVYFAKKKGRSNSILYTVDNQSCASPLNEDAENIIELKGMNAELVINEYTHAPWEV